MAGKALQRIYCWELKAGDLDIYMASTSLGGIRVSVGLGKHGDCLEFHEERFHGAPLTMDRPRNLGLIRAVEAALDNRRVPVPPLDVFLSPFQDRVYRAISRIPSGGTWTYGDVARSIGKAKGARAVGQALKNNPFPLIFP